MKKIIKKPIFIILAVIVILAGVGVFFSIKGKQPTYEFSVVKRMNLVQEVSTTGRVKPAETIDLAFEKPGLVSAAYVNVGDNVKTGQVLVRLEGGELAAQLLGAQANLEAEQAKLEEMKKGTRPEELQAAETKVSNYEKSLKDAQDNLAGAQGKAYADLKNVYDAALSASQKAVTVGKNALITFTDIQYSHFISPLPENFPIANAKQDAVFLLLGQRDAGWFSAESIGGLEGGAYADTKKAVADPTYANIDQALSSAIDALQKVKSALEAIPISSSLTSTEKTDLNTEKTNVNAEITNVSTKEQAVSVQKTTNTNSIIAAQISLTTAENNLANAKDDLSLKRAGSTQEQIVAQEAKVKSARANVSDVLSQISKRTLYSPISGVIKKQEAKVGEIAQANSLMVSLISEKLFEVETNIPEADIAKVKVGDTVKITLDAYGSDVVFDARVFSIEPAETIIDGVATYLTKLEFVNEDEKIKPGMTANIDILTDKRDSALAIPQRAVFSKDGEKLVKVLGDDKKIKEIPVQIGMRDSSGNVEILEGLKEGDKVVTFTQEKK